MNEQCQFGDESLQSVTGTDKPEQQDTEHVQNTNQCNPQNGPNKQLKSAQRDAKPARWLLHIDAETILSI